MTDIQARRLSMFVRVREFIAQRLGDFSESGVARQLYTQLQTVITRVEALSAAQASGMGQAHQKTHARGSARTILREAVEAIHAVAVTMGLGDQFPLPERSDALLMQGARSMAADAVALKEQFLAHDVPADFIEDLQAKIIAFAAEIAEQGNAVGDHVQAGVALDDAIDEGVEIVNKLDGIMQAKYASNHPVLAEWTSASHTERPPKRSTAAPPPAPGAPATGGTPPPGP
jgi:hypothetical protein